MSNAIPKTHHSSKKEATEALSEIRSKYSRIKPADVLHFAPVYYPIAIVEMCLEEQTFEDFETVQLAVLRLVALGISDHTVIAKTLGLSSNYVFKVLRLLISYGHISGNQLTPLGKQSLIQEKKIIITEMSQKFQVDALNGTLLRVGQVLTENALRSKTETARVIGHLSYMDGIDADLLRHQLSGTNGEQYLHQKSGILHTNVIAVKDTNCLQIQYAKCYMLKLRTIEQPIIFGKRYDRRKKDMKDRFSWQPLCVGSATIRDRLGFEKDTTLTTETAQNYIRQLYAMLTEHGQKVNLAEEIPRAITRVYPFREEALEIIPQQCQVRVTDEAIGPFRSSFVNFLLDAYNDGAYLITNEYLFGRVISLSLAGPQLTKLAELLSQKANTLSVPELKGILKDKFRDHNDETPLIPAMLQILKTL